MEEALAANRAANPLKVQLESAEEYVARCEKKQTSLQKAAEALATQLEALRLDANRALGALREQEGFTRLAKADLAQAASEGLARAAGGLPVEEREQAPPPTGVPRRLRVCGRGQCPMGGTRGGVPRQRAAVAVLGTQSE